MLCDMSEELLGLGRIIEKLHEKQDPLEIKRERRGRNIVAYRDAV